jgi:hypothetical protein
MKLFLAILLAQFIFDCHYQPAKPVIHCWTCDAIRKPLQYHAPRRGWKVGQGGKFADTLSLFSEGAS